MYKARSRWFQVIGITAAGIVLLLIVMYYNVSLASDSDPQHQEVVLAETKSKPDIDVPSVIPAQIQSSSTVSMCNIDTVLALALSDSMYEETRCYGCYEPTAGQDYPDGIRRPLPYTDWICAPQQPLTYTQMPYQEYEILVAEAEYFSSTTSWVAGDHDYHYTNYVYAGTFWTLQRVQDSQASGYNYEMGDQRGAHLMHGPHTAYHNGHKTVTGDAPHLGYNFDISASDTWYIWLRAQCGNFAATESRADGCTVHWGVDGTPLGSTSYDDFDRRGGYDAGADGNRWQWVRVGGTSLTAGAHEVDIWGGGTGFRLDKIVITRIPEGESARIDHAPDFIVQTTPTDWEAIQNQPGGTYQTYHGDNRFGGPPDTCGRNGWACWRCNSMYGLDLSAICQVGQLPDANCQDWDGNGRIDRYEICDQSFDDLFDDLQPIRAVKESAKQFVRVTAQPQYKFKETLMQNK